MKNFFDKENFGDRKTRMDQWRQDYQREVGPEQRTILFRGGRNHNTMKTTNAYERDPMEDEFNAEANAAIEELLAYLKDPPSDKALIELLRVSQKTLEICGRHGLHPLGFAGRCGHEAWKRESLIRHVAECDDPECGNECRAARGLPPLASNDRLELRSKLDQRKREQKDRVRRAIKGGRKRG